MSQRSSGSIQKLKKSAVFWELLGAPVLLKTRVRNFTHPVQFGILPKRLSLPYLDAGILSGYEEDASSIRDGISEVGSPDHLARKHSSSKEEYRFDADVPNRLTEQKRLSICNWNPGPRRGKEGAIEKHIAGKWQNITLQAIEYLDSEFLTNRFHVTNYGACAILFNKDTFLQDIKVTSVHLHDTRDAQQQDVKEGESGMGIVPATVA